MNAKTNEINLAQIIWLGLIFTHVAKGKILRGEDEVKATARS